MFEEHKLFDLFKSLEPEQQHEAIDFMEFIKQRKNKTENQLQEQKRPQLTFGCMKGIVKYMADDFDAPLEDFAEYM
jgi:hypothetical protein